MTRTLVVSIALLVAGLAVPAQADERLSRGEIVEIEDALDAWGCSGYDEIEKEDGPMIIYEIDDATCGDGEYDIKLDADFQVISTSRD